MFKNIASLFILGLSFGSGPCLVSCGPLLLSYIVGTQKKIRGGLFTYIIFSLARITVYLILALLVFFLGRFVFEGLLAAWARYIFILGGVFIMVLGALMILGKNGNQCCVLLKDKFLAHDKKSIILLGLLTALVPCAPLIAMLSYLGLTSAQWWQSLLGAFSFSAGVFISPLIILSALGGLIPRWLKGRQAVLFNCFSGIIMLILGWQMLRRVF